MRAPRVTDETILAHVKRNQPHATATIVGSLWHSSGDNSRRRANIRLARLVENGRLIFKRGVAGEVRQSKTFYVTDRPLGPVCPHCARELQEIHYGTRRWRGRDRDGT